MNLFLSLLVFFSLCVDIGGSAARWKLRRRPPRPIEIGPSEEWEHQLRTYPELATSVGDNRFNDRLTDYSREAIEREVDHAKKAVAGFEAIDPTGFPEQERLSRDLMIRNLREQIEGAQFKDWEMPLDQMNGLHIGLASLPSITTFHSVKDYQDYAARLHQIPRALDQATANMRHGASKTICFSLVTCWRKS